MTLATRFFKEVLGLDDAVVKKVIGTIRASGNGQNIGSANIRRKIGPQALTLITKGLEAIGGSDKGKPATSVEPSKNKSDDSKPDRKTDRKRHRALQKDADKNGEKEMTDDIDIKESFTLKDYLINEVTTSIEVDTNDPAAAAMAVKKHSRLVGNDPNRASRHEMKNAQLKKKEAQDDDTPEKPVKQQIARKQQELAMLNKRLRNSERQNA